jgi:phosphohistidine swiveling domain-containing protein
LSDIGVRPFRELTGEELRSAGGKGENLARLFKAGYPVPDGLVILPHGFRRDELSPEAWAEVKALIGGIRGDDREASFAVRSSALGEDSAQASFAGEFETVLDVHGDEEIWEAIHKVRRSREAERVRAYRRAHGMEEPQEISVVVQRMLHPEVSGVLFTADPVTGSTSEMMGNFIHGLGDRLVSGEANPETFTLRRPGGQYEGPPEMRRFAPRLLDLANGLEGDLGGPQDIEWALVGSELFLLQTRPITTMVRYNPATGEQNDSLLGECLWTSQLAGEIIPEVMTPATWSVWEIFFNIMRPKGYPSLGNICGRPYINYSLLYTMVRKFGRSPEDARAELETKMGRLPGDMDIPMLPLTTMDLLFDIVPLMARTLWSARSLRKRIPETISGNPGRCDSLKRRILDAQDGEALASIWLRELKPIFLEMALTQDSANDAFFIPYTELSKELSRLIGEDEADNLVSTMRSRSSTLASLGPLMGLSKILSGEMSRDEYMRLYGHRGPLEDMISRPSPAETLGWLDEQLADYTESPVDFEELFGRSDGEFEEAWGRFSEAFPAEAGPLRRKMDQFMGALVTREAVRSELTRVVSVIRVLFLRAGKLTGLGDDVFFVTWQELVDVLNGDESSTRHIPARRATYRRYSELPPYPMLIIGAFNPFQWAADPNRRSDIYDSRAPSAPLDTETLRGLPGSAGRVEGFVRRIDSPDEEESLRRGEILVTKTTNIGWTPLFTRIAAVVTDIGAPLSHAAIVARELGIPAVVGCGNATAILRTGDLVRIDGGRGVIEILERAD